jgi:hypothetical protein
VVRDSLLPLFYIYDRIGQEVTGVHNKRREIVFGHYKKGGNRVIRQIRAREGEFSDTIKKAVFLFQTESLPKIPFP